MIPCTAPGRQLLVLSVGLLFWSVVANLLIGDTLYTVRNLALTGLLLAGWLRMAGPGENSLEDVGLTRSSLFAGARWGVGAVVFGLWHIALTIVTLRINEVEVASLASAGAIAGAVLVTTVAGVGFCWFRLRSGSLVAPILAHWATNALGLLAASTQG